MSHNNQRRLKQLQQSDAVWTDDTLAAPESGLIISRFGQHADVEDSQGNIFRCHLRRSIESLVTGDTVIWRKALQQNQRADGVIEVVNPRHSVLLRPDYYDGLKPVAANIDLMIIVSAVLPELSFNIIDRYLVASEITRIPPLLLINKIDLLTETQLTALDKQLQLYRDLGYPCLLLSSETGQGMAELQQHLHSGTSVFVGQSGVGKSSLVNQLIPGLAVTTQQISETSGLGQHTTTASRLYHLEGGGAVIDSPGIREFALWHLSPQNVTDSFIEFRPWLNRCKFRDCKHITDPGCAILHAIENGAVSQQRYDSYLKILASMQQDKPNYI